MLCARSIGKRTTIYSSVSHCRILYSSRIQDPKPKANVSDNPEQIISLAQALTIYTTRPRESVPLRTIS